MKIIDKIRTTFTATTKESGRVPEQSERRNFIRKAMLGGAGAVATGAAVASHTDSHMWLWNSNQGSLSNTLATKAHQHSYAEITGTPPSSGSSGVAMHMHAENINTTQVAVGSISNTIPKRDTAKNIHTNEFRGRATSANWADLAEKYKSDRKYEEGDVLGVGGEDEVTEYNPGTPLAGVVSLYPAFQMNDTYETRDWPFVALKGRVPVKINGSAKKGDYIVADKEGKGVAVAFSDIDRDNHQIIGVSLQDGSELIEVKI